MNENRFNWRRFVVFVDHGNKENEEKEEKGILRRKM